MESDTITKEEFPKKIGFTKTTEMAYNYPSSQSPRNSVSYNGTPMRNGTPIQNGTPMSYNGSYSGTTSPYNGTSPYGGTPYNLTPPYSGQGSPYNATPPYIGTPPPYVGNTYGTPPYNGASPYNGTPPYSGTPPPYINRGGAFEPTYRRTSMEGQPPYTTSQSQYNGTSQVYRRPPARENQAYVNNGRTLLHRRTSSTESYNGAQSNFDGSPSSHTSEASINSNGTYNGTQNGTHSPSDGTLSPCSDGAQMTDIGTLSQSDGTLSPCSDGAQMTDIGTPPTPTGDTIMRANESPGHKGSPSGSDQPMVGAVTSEPGQSANQSSYSNIKETRTNYTTGTSANNNSAGMEHTSSTTSSLPSSNAGSLERLSSRVSVGSMSSNASIGSSASIKSDTDIEENLDDMQSWSKIKFEGKLQLNIFLCLEL